MHSFVWAKIGVHYPKDDPYASSYREAFDHAGLHLEDVAQINAADISRFHVLLLCGYGKLSDSQVASVSEWVRKGGCVVCSGSAWRLEPLLGLAAETKHLSSSLMRPEKPDRLWPEGAELAHFFGGAHKKATNCEVVAGCDNAGVALSRRKNGKGWAVFLAPHVGQTIRLMQMGRSVECDGIGPSDGSAVLDNGILRAEDGTALEFGRDRCSVEGCDIPFFGYPHADTVRECLLRALFFCTDHRSTVVPMFWHWPRAARGAALLTMDCEEFEPDNVNKLYRTLSMFGMPAAWMVALPGYPVDVYRAIRAWDHEVGLLFLTDDEAGWHEEKMKIQLTAVARLSAQQNMMSARPHDGRWRGWTRFYELCELSGARVSLSKGGRQPGTSGFLFGTCHPFVPQRRDGSGYLVTEVPQTIYHPGAVTPDPAADRIIFQTALRYGCLHIACPSDVIKSAPAAASLRRVLSVCKQQKLEFMLPEQVQRFERGRRALRISQRVFDDEGTLHISSDVALEGLTLMVSGPRIAAEVKGKDVNVGLVERYGAKFNVVQMNVEAKQQVDVRLEPNFGQQAAA